jgi:hypothetical protein
LRGGAKPKGSDWSKGHRINYPKVSQPPGQVPGHHELIFHNEHAGPLSHRGLASTTTEGLPVVMDLHVKAAAV